jgi:hypothetical protein
MPPLRRSSARTSTPPAHTDRHGTNGCARGMASNQRHISALDHDMRCAFQMRLGLMVEDCRYSLVGVHRLRLSLPGDGCALSRDCLNCMGAPRLGRNWDRQIARSADPRTSSEDLPDGLLPNAFVCLFFEVFAAWPTRWASRPTRPLCAWASLFLVDSWSICSRGPERSGRRGFGYLWRSPRRTRPISISTRAVS